MFQIRIFVKLGGKVGELDLKKRDLADLCEIQPGAAGEGVSGGIERISLVDLARIMQELELYSLDDVFEVRIVGTPPPPEGRRERIFEKLKPLREKRKAEDRERRKLKAIEQRRRIEDEIRQEAKRRKSKYY